MQRLKNNKYNRLMVITALVLGDGCIDRERPDRLVIHHGIKQLEYIKWKKELLEYLFSESINLSLKDNGGYPSAMFRFRHPTVLRLRSSLYMDGRRRITEGILNQMNHPAAWAIWYQDDGSMIHHKVTNKLTGIATINNRTIRLNANRYTGNELQLVAAWMSSRLGVTPRIEREGPYFRLAMGMQQGSKFIDYIKPFIVPSMTYKLDPQYGYVRVPRSGTPLKIQSDPGRDTGSPAEMTGPASDGE